MIREDGAIKVLDFGLAKAMAEEASDSVPADSPTITANFTRPGVVLGTAAYMSPEQARGRPLDKRTDIWSFGVILHECLTGSSLFQGETATDSIGAVVSGRGQQFPIWMKRDTPNRFRLSFQEPGFAIAPDVPDPNGEVGTCGRHISAVRMERDSVD